MKAAPKILLGRWLHSHEEDTDAELVYRPATYRFPPSRGRTGFELRPDGTMVESGIGPTDRRAESPGTWRLSGNTLVLDRAAGSRVLAIVDAAPDRLKVSR
jgi:hypothetical protein